MVYKYKVVYRSTLHIQHFKNIYDVTLLHHGSFKDSLLYQAVHYCLTFELYTVLLQEFKVLYVQDMVYYHSKMRQWMHE